MAFAEICLAAKNSLGHIVLGDHFVNPRILDPEFLLNLGAGVKVGKGLSDAVRRTRCRSIDCKSSGTKARICSDFIF